MSDDDFLYDIFFSYNINDEAKVRQIYDAFGENGLRPFFAPTNLQKLVGTSHWEEAILAAIPKSHHLGVYCSKDAAISKWVLKEVAKFRTSAEHREGADQRILVIRDPALSEHDLEGILSTIGLDNVLRPSDWLHAMRIVTDKRMGHLSTALASAKEELAQTKNLARQSFEYYRHMRFWKPFSDPSGQSLHIFTCGRDTAEGAGQRGSGGRTSIDKWDYQAVVDITHHFARHYRDIGVVIEQPVSKARIDEETRMFDTAEFTQKLINRNCVVIGSPDVSDFAEITLASLLGVKSYSPTSKLATGFRIMKDGRRFSTFYEQSSAENPDGVRLMRRGQADELFVCEDDRDLGVLVLADNPFSEPGNEHKILILAGHSGTATRAMSLLLTNEDPWCLEAFYVLEQQIAVMSGPIAAVIEVTCERVAGRDPKIGDDRMISSGEESIRVCATMALQA